LRARALSTFLGSLTILVVGAPAAAAGGTGGVAPGSGGAGSSSSAGSSASGPATPTTPIHAAPITARSRRLSYGGPVYEKTATGEVIPYQPRQATG